MDIFLKTLHQNFTLRLYITVVFKEDSYLTSMAHLYTYPDVGHFQSMMHKLNV